MSSYEEKILMILMKSNIEVVREKSFKDLKKGQYRYDFYLPKLNILLEVQGAQHYEFTPHFHKDPSDFRKRQEADRRKITYALANGYTLYCIPYWEIDNIKEKFDILNPKFVAKNKWKNDKDWSEHKNLELK